jgi:hypothetical protein
MRYPCTGLGVIAVSTRDVTAWAGRLPVIQYPVPFFSHPRDRSSVVVKHRRAPGWAAVPCVPAR